MVSGVDSSPAKSTKKPAKRLPTSWTPTEEHQKRANEAGLDLPRLATEFRLHAEEKGRTAVNWNAAFTRWLMNAAEWKKPNARPAAPTRPHVSTLQAAPSGMTDEEYDAWEAAQRVGA